MAPHSSTLDWKMPWTEEPGRLQSMRLRRVRHDWATSLSLFTFMHWRKKWQPTPVSLLGESQGRWSLVGCHLWGRRVGHDWSDLAVSSSTPKYCLQLVFLFLNVRVFHIEAFIVTKSNLLVRAVGLGYGTTMLHMSQDDTSKEEPHLGFCQTVHQ